MKKVGLVVLILAVFLLIAGCTTPLPTPPAGGNPLASTADYGDAPNGSRTNYPQPFAQTGEFPTLYDANGARTLNIDVARLGPDASMEKDAADPNDPDGVPNLNPSDTDFDDGLVTIVVVTVSIPPPGTLTVNVTSPQGSNGGKFNLNVLIDLDMDGSWGGTAGNGEPEWVVKNYPVNIPSGPSSLLVTPPSFAFANGNLLPDGAWMRIALTKERVTAQDWDGTGEFKEGEIEDHVILLPEFPTTTTTTRTPPPITPPPPKWSCADNSITVKFGFNPFAMIGGVCKDDCKADEVCDALSCTCDKKPKKPVQCSQGFTGIFGFSSFDPATEVCRNDCNPFTEVCDQATCVCKPIKDENLCSRGPHYDPPLGAMFASLRGEVCRDDCDKTSETCNYATCECEEKPPKEVSCSEGSQGFSWLFDVCKNDCKEGLTCNPISCVCEKEPPKEVSCSEGSQDFEYFSDICKSDCDEGLKCDTLDCVCKKPKKFACSDKRTITRDYSTDKSNYNDGIDTCEDNCFPDEWCNPWECSCEPKAVVSCANQASDLQFDSDIEICKDNCPSDQTCNTESCTCEKKEPKEYKCWDNLQEVDKTDINNFETNYDTCADNCPTGYKCAGSSCTCVKDIPPKKFKCSDRETVTSGYSTDKQQYASGYDICEDNCDGNAGEVCNAESCVCETYQTSFSCAENTDDTKASGENSYPPPDSLSYYCIEDCPDGWTCTEACVCEPEEEILASCASTTKPRNWNMCSRDCPTGETCNVESCVCEKDPVPASCSSLEKPQESYYCVDDCPQGETCDTETCLCIGDEIVAYCGDDTNPNGWNTCNDNCPQGYTCNTEACVCIQDLTCADYTDGFGSSGHDTQSDCEASCIPGTCFPSTSPACWFCRTCEDMGKSSSQSACETSCQSPDYCQIDELSGCWSCVDVICNPPLHETPTCDNQCDLGYTCVDQGLCYKCECQVDLGFSSTYSSSSWHASESCYNNECMTTCSLDSFFDVEVRNLGSGPSGGYNVWIDVGPLGGPMQMSETTTMPPLGPGGTIPVEIVALSLTAELPGRLDVCNTLPWWVGVGNQYQVTYDIGYSGSDCNPSNNMHSITGTVTSNN